MGLLRASAAWIQGELNTLGVPPAVSFCLGHAARTRPESLPPNVPAPHVGRDTVYAFVMAGIDSMRTTPARELRMNIAERMWWAAFSNTAEQIFSKSYAEQERRRELAPGSMSAYLQAQLAYGEAATLCTRYWNTPRGADGRYVVVGSNAEKELGVVAGINCLWLGDGHTQQIAGMLVVDILRVGFFDLDDVKASDLNDGNPAYSRLEYLLEVFVNADPLIDTEGYKRLHVESARRNTLIDLTFEDGSKWKCEIARELLYGQDGVSHRKLLNDFLGALDAAWTSVVGEEPSEEDWDDYDESFSNDY